MEDFRISIADIFDYVGDRKWFLKEGEAVVNAIHILPHCLAAMVPEPYIETLVADSAAFLRAVPLQHMARHVVTCDEVVDEIRDRATRDRLQVLPYELQLRQPSDEAVRQVSQFARQTGDLRFLSATDVRVLALTLQVTRETMGEAHLRLQPTPAPQRVHTQLYHPRDGRPGTASDGLPVGFVADKVAQLAVTDGDDTGGGEGEHRDNTGGGEGEHRDDTGGGEGEHRDDTGGEGEHTQQHTTESAAEAKSDSGRDSGAEQEPQMDSVYSTAESEPAGGGSADEADELSAEEDMYDARESAGSSGSDGESDSGGGEEADDGGEADNGGEEADDGGGWITPANVEAAKMEMGALGGDTREPVQVACLTTDFTMQNVLKQMNLDIVSVDGRRIRETRRFVLRCFGCFQITPNMEKLFCPWCGNKTLKRVSVTLRPDGTQQVHISTRKPISKRGTKFSLPLPRGGKYNVAPLLCEDQPRPQQRSTRRSQAQNAVLSDDYVTGCAPFAARDVNSRAAVLGRSGAGRATPNWLRRNPNVRAPPTGNKKKRRK